MKRRAHDVADIRRLTQTPQNVIGAVAAAGLAIVFGLLLLGHDPLVFWNDDYELSILPVCADIARAWNQGEFPLLSPYSWICGNLAGEFQYGVFSIFINALIICIWKLPLIFFQQAAALSLAHLAVLSAGAFLLARDRHLSLANSMLVALIASANGWIICWGASDWFGALGAFAWLPWAWWGAERALDVASASSRRSPTVHGQDARATSNRWRFLWPAPFVYLLITGGFPYTVLMLALVLAWLALRTAVGAIDLASPVRTRPGAAEYRAGGSMNRAYLRWARIIPLAFGVALGVGLAAPAWLALLDYVQGSARESLNSSAHSQWLVPWNAWPGLILPSWTVNWANFSSQLSPHGATEFACGLVPPVVLLAGFFANARALWKKIRWEIALLIIVFILAMIPTAGVFRWSFRWLPLFHLVLAICAAEALQMLKPENAMLTEQKKKSSQRLVIKSPPFLVLLLMIVLVIAGLALRTGGEHLFPLAWIFFGLAVVWFVIERQPTRSALLREWAPMVVAFVALLATYFSIPPNCGVPKYNFAQSLLDPQPLDPQRLYLSVYPPPENFYRVEAKPGPVGQIVRPGSASMWAGLRFINGYSPIRPAGVARVFASAIHGEIDPNLAEWLLQHDAHSDGFLERIGIDGIIVAREFNFAPQPAGDWEVAFANNEARVFHRRRGVIPRVRQVDFFGKNVTANVADIRDSRNSVSASVDVPAGAESALIAFSRPFFRGYQACIGNQRLVVSSYRELVPTVEVPAGTRGRLWLVYRPGWLLYGGAIATASAVIWIVAAILALRGFAGGRCD